MAIADAYVDLHVDGGHLEGEIRSSVKSAMPKAEKDVDKHGSRLGDRFANGFFRGFSKKIKIGGGKFSKSIKEMFAGFNPRSLMIPALVAALPLLTSLISSLSGALVSLVGALAQAGGASLAFVGVAGAMVQGLLVAKIAFGDLGKAVKGDKKALAALGPEGKQFVKTLQGMGKEWAKVKKSIQAKAFEGLSPIVERLGKNLFPVLQRQLGGTSTVLNGIIRDVGGFVSSERFAKKFGTALKGNNAILGRLGMAAKPAIKGLLNGFIALQPAGLRLANMIQRVVHNLAAVTKQGDFGDRVSAFMDKAFSSAIKVWTILKNLGKAIHNIFGAATPAGDGLLTTLAQLAGKFADFTSLTSTKEGIAKWAQQGIDVTKTLFGWIWKIGGLLAPLFSPQIASGFFAVFESLMPIIASVTGVIKDALAPVLETIGKAFAENGPKIAGLFQALSPLLGGIGAVIGQIISQALNTIGTIAAIITPVVKILANFLGPLLKRFAPIIAFLILAFTNWGSAIVKILPYVGRFIAPLVRLAEIISSKLAPIIKFAGKLVAKVFPVIAKIIGAAAKSAGKVVGFYFKIIGKVVTVAMRIVRAVISRVMGGLRAVFGGPLRFIRGLFSRIFNGIKGIVVRVFGAIRDIVGKRLGGIVDFVKKIPNKILNLAGNFLQAGLTLGKKVISGLGEGLRAVGGFVGNIGESIKNAINSVLHLPVHISGPGPLPDFDIPAFAGGGTMRRGGLALVGERGPELAALPRNTRVYSNNESKKMAAAGPTLPRKVILRIGARDFEAYVTEIADDRVNAADNLAWQGA